MATETKKKHVWSSITLRLKLFKIWFMKNILLFIEIFGIICLILMLTGCIKQSTPIIGPPLYLFFGELIDAINDGIASKNINGLMDFLGILASILVSVGMFTMRAKSIAQSDIKSDKLKIALIQANLYFNEDGRLTKKIEKMTDTDIDGDGKADGSIVSNKGLIGNIISAVKEFTVIASADLSGTEEENQAAYDNTIKDVGYEVIEPAVDEVVDTIKTGLKNQVIDETVQTIDKQIETTKEDTEKTVVEKTKKIGILAKLKEMFMLKKKRNTKKEETTVEVVENNMEADTEVVEETKTAPATPQEVIAKSQQKVQQPATHDAASEYLRKMRGM